ncbi:MAG: TonB-dependent receptor [Bacteroidales bacterium]
MYLRGVEIDPGLDLSTKKTREVAGYLSDQIILGEKWSLRAGLRFTIWQNVGPSTEYSKVPVEVGGIQTDSLVVTPHPNGEVYWQYISMDPRLSFVYQPDARRLWKASYSRTSQFQYLITNSISPFTSLEVWLPAGPNVAPQFAHQFTLGYLHRFGPGLRVDTEVYVKKMTSLIDYKDHAHMLLNPLLEYELRFGKGHAYGLETILHKEKGAFTGWLSYTWSRAFHVVEGISGGNPYPAYSDRPHDLSLYVSWNFRPRLSLTANFIYMTGAPFTTPTGFYLHDNHQVPVYLERNNDRLPDYHRLDVALNLQLNRPGKRFEHELVFSIYNLYNRKNPVSLNFNMTQDANGNFVVPADFYSQPQLVASQYYLYGIIPSLSYHFRF